MLPALLTWLTWLSSTVYGGTVVTFAVLFALYPRVSGRPRVEIARVYRSAGPVLGLAMGGWVLGLVAGRYVRLGSVTWTWQSPSEQLDLAAWLVFLGIWVSNFILEIWTMDPLRAQVEDETLRVLDADAFARGYRSTSQHLALQAMLFVLWSALVTALRTLG